MSDPALPVTEQAPQSTPPPTQQAPVTTPPPTPETPPTAEATPEQIAQWQTQAAQAQQLAQQLQQQNEQYRQLQGAYTRGQQALAQLGATPPPPPQDPIAPYVSQLTQQGYSEKDARAIATMNYNMVQQQVTPLQQQLQQSQQQLHGGLQVDQVLQQVYQANPSLFANQAIFDQTRQGLMQTVMAGGQIDPQYAEYAAVIANHEAGKRQQQTPPPHVIQFAPPQQQQQQPIPQPFANGMFRMAPNFQPQQQAGPAALPADAAFVDQEMRARFNLSPKTA